MVVLKGGGEVEVDGKNGGGGVLYTACEKSIFGQNSYGVYEKDAGCEGGFVSCGSPKVAPDVGKDQAAKGQRALL